MEFSLDYFFGKKMLFLKRVNKKYAGLRVLMFLFTIASFIALVPYLSDDTLGKVAGMILVVLGLGWLVYLFNSIPLNKMQHGVYLYARYDNLAIGWNKWWEVLRFILYCSGASYILYLFFKDKVGFYSNGLLFLLCLYQIVESGYALVYGQKPSRKIYMVANTLYVTHGIYTYYTPLDDLVEIRLCSEFVTFKSKTGLVDRLHGYEMTDSQLKTLEQLIKTHSDNLIVNKNV